MNHPLINESTDPANTGPSGMALTATLALLAVVCAGLPLFHRVGALEIAALLGVAAISAWSAWRAARNSQLLAEWAAQAAGPPRRRCRGPT